MKTTKTLKLHILLPLSEFAQQMRLEAVNPDRLLWDNSNGNFFRVAQFRAEFGILLRLNEFAQQMNLEAVNPDRLLWDNSNGNFFRIAQFRAEFGRRGFICRRFPQMLGAGSQHRLIPNAQDAAASR